MAVMTLELVLAAGVCSRAVTRWIVSGVNTTHRTRYAIVKTTEEAKVLIRRVLNLNVKRRKNKNRQTQAESEVMVSRKASSGSSEAMASEIAGGSRRVC